MPFNDIHLEKAFLPLHPQEGDTREKRISNNEYRTQNSEIKTS